ncbi:MAG: hypothetical protein GC185_12150 [Alphaproteobacteria bacterium]|nr:hypothetical protein [Alphaproteobacteria bacterium]
MSRESEKKWVEVEDARADKSGAPLPRIDIDGANFFSGPYRGEKGRPGSRGVISMTDMNWRQMWRSLGEAPPGPLPEGAVAVMNAVYSKDDPADYLPLKISNDGKHNDVTWQLRHTAVEGETPRPSRYAVLILPRGTVRQETLDVWRRDEIAREKARAEERAAERAVITEGLKKPVKAMPKIQIKKPKGPGR